MPIKKALRPLYKDPAYLEARAAAKLRSRDCCEHCKRPNGMRLMRWAKSGDADGVKVIQCGGAHADQDPRNNSHANVLWLCRGCHLRHDALPHSVKARV